MSEDHSFLPSEKVLLWDGKMYPRARVEQELTGLSDYASEHETLTEIAPFDLGKTVLRTGLMILCITFIAGVLFFVTTGDLLVSIFMFLLLTAALAVLQGIGFVWTAKTCRSTISIKDGIVSIHHSRMNFEFPLDSFQWYVGKARHDTMLRRTVYPNNQTIILVTRAKFNWFPAMKYKIACGFTPETRARWEAFLKLAEIPRGQGGRQIVRPIREKRKSA